MSDDESWVDDGKANTINRFDTGDTRATHVVVGFSHTQGLDVQPSEEAWPSLRRGGGGHAVLAPSLTKYNMDSRSPQSQEQTRIVESVHKATSVVRRLTPLETERLMGWPDQHTAPEGIKAPDSKRYAACGDGIVANVAFWIGNRINQIEQETP